MRSGASYGNTSVSRHTCLPESGPERVSAETGRYYPGNRPPALGIRAGPWGYPPHQKLRQRCVRRRCGLRAATALENPPPPRAASRRFSENVPGRGKHDDDDSGHVPRRKGAKPGAARRYDRPGRTRVGRVGVGPWGRFAWGLYAERLPCPTRNQAIPAGKDPRRRQPLQVDVDPRAANRGRRLVDRRDGREPWPVSPWGPACDRHRVPAAGSIGREAWPLGDGRRLVDRRDGPKLGRGRS